MLVRQPGIGSGVLHPAAYTGKFELARFRPTPPLDDHIAVLWTASWDRQGQPPFEHYALPHASVHVVLEGTAGKVMGVIRGRFLRSLAGCSRVFGAKFKPGMFRPWVDQDVDQLSDSSRPFGAIFGVDEAAFVSHVFSASSEDEMAHRYAEFWQQRLPAPDPKAFQARDLVSAIENDRDITQVVHLAEFADMPVRSLQRLFRSYVGVSPKWVIQRYRLIEASDALAAGEVTQADLALRLGFADQAHFVRAFRNIVGMPPANYAKLNLPAADGPERYKLAPS